MNLAEALEFYASADAAPAAPGTCHRVVLAAVRHITQSPSACQAMSSTVTRLLSSSPCHQPGGQGVHRREASVPILRRVPPDHQVHCRWRPRRQIMGLRMAGAIFSLPSRAASQD